MPTQREKDAAAIEKLAEHGSNLSKPHEVEFFIYFPSKKSALAAAAEMEAKGCSVVVRPSADPWWKRLFSTDKWLCLATKSVPPNDESISPLTEWFEELAARHGGNFDGWGT